MSYITPEVITRVKQLDLLTYLQNYEPNELVHFSGNTYTTRTHDSLKISNGLWNWFSVGVGGKTALEYLIKVKGYTFIESVNYLANIEHLSASTMANIYNDVTKSKLILPEKNNNNDKVVNYLKSRGINQNIIYKCINDNIVYEDTSHNVIFVGYDENNVARYAQARATNSSRFMHDITGSNKAYSFMFKSQTKSNSIHIFEGAIDLLSYASLLVLKGYNYENYNMISLAGVYQPAKIIEQSKIPKTIEKFLISNPDINEIVLHLDNDIAGRNATKAFQIVMKDTYKIIDNPVPRGKDVNDYLCACLGIRKNINSKGVERQWEK